MRLTVSLRFSPDADLRVGTLFDLGRDVAFEYDPAFLATGLNIAPFRMPPQRGVVVHDRSGNMDTFGVFEDSLPDGWGRRLIDNAYRRRHGRLPTALERLTCVGANGRGALAYEPEEPMDAESAFGDLAMLAQSAMDFDAGKAEDVLPEVCRAGGSSGGARPKAFLGFNPQTGEICAERNVLPPGFEHWIVKFNTRRDGPDAGPSGISLL